MKKILAPAIGAGIVAASAMMTSVPAHAVASACSSTRYGNFCVVANDRGYNAQLQYTAKNTAVLDFNLQCQSGYWAGDYGEFTAYPGNQYSFVFQVGSRGLCRVVAKNHSGTVVAATPYLNR